MVSAVAHVMSHLTRMMMSRLHLGHAVMMMMQTRLKFGCRMSTTRGIKILIKILFLGGSVIGMFKLITVIIIIVVKVVGTIGGVEAGR